MATLYKLDPDRIQTLNSRPVRPDGKYVLYWMDASLRQRYNSALEYAIQWANSLDLGVLVVYCFDTLGQANTERRAVFILEALLELQQSLKERKIQLVVQSGSAHRIIPAMAENAAGVVTDCGYLRQDRSVRKFAAQRIDCLCVQVEDNIIVPVETASTHAEYSARTFRPKVTRNMDRFLKLPPRTRVNVSSLGQDWVKLNLNDRKTILAEEQFRHQVGRCSNLPGGESAARAQWKRFVRYNLIRYNQRLNPNARATSMISPYLNFGCISPVELAIHLQELSMNSTLDSEFSDATDIADEVQLVENIKTYREELIVRRELAINYVWYNPCYDSFEGLPQWSKKTLELHATDQRLDHYSFQALEAGQTLDVYWNAAQTTLTRQGWMEPYLRMYWGKQLLRWTREPIEAYEYARILNDRYELDGMAPGGYAGVGWCFGLHDLPFHARPIFGFVREMAQSGLIKKIRKHVTPIKTEEQAEELELV